MGRGQLLAQLAQTERGVGACASGSRGVTTHGTRNLNYSELQNRAPPAEMLLFEALSSSDLGQIVTCDFPGEVLPEVTSASRGVPDDFMRHC